MARPTEEIKDRLDIVEFIKGYLELRQAGKNFKALCPFHNEKTPSFMVSPERGTWHCFGCGEGGDIFQFIMRYENLEFYEALRVLAEKAGVELKRISPEDQKQFGVLYELNSAAADFFEEALKNSEKCKKYVEGRGLKEETIKEFAVGFAPPGTDELTVALINKGYAVEDIVRSGLTIKTERGRYIDRFRGRLMFPIHNHFGKIIGFSGRILPEFDTGNVGKYINSPDTPIYNKSRVLYGFWESKRAIREEDKALLVEGQTDFLLTWQDGIKNVVATSGTALTFEHLRAIRRITGKIVIGFDKDNAGQMAMERSIDLAGTQDFTVYILSLGDYDDPADAVQKAPGFLKKAIQEAKGGMEYYFDRYLTPSAMERIDEKKAAIRTVLLKIKSLWSPVERAHWIGVMSHRTGINEKQLIEELERISVGAESKSVSVEEAREVRKLGRRDMITEQILSFVTGNDNYKKEIASSADLIPTNYKEVFDAIMGKGEEMTSDAEKTLNLITLQAGLIFSIIPEERLDAEFKNLLKELTIEYLRIERERIGAQISVAEENKDDSKVAKLLREFDDVLRKMQDVEDASQETEEIRR